MVSSSAEEYVENASSQSKKKPLPKRSISDNTAKLSKLVEQFFVTDGPALDFPIPVEESIEDDALSDQGTYSPSSSSSSSSHTDLTGERNERFGSSQPFPTVNGEQYGRSSTELEVNDEQKPQPSTVNHRLRQARNFLSDEDATRRGDFVRCHGKIDRFLRQVANDKDAFDVALYDQVKAMIQVHRLRMDEQELEQVNSLLSTSQSRRLPLADPSKRKHLRGAPLRDDHPPFTLERPVDQNLFIKALHEPPVSSQPGVEDRRRQLLSIEGAGFSEALQNPPLIHERIAESESQTRDAKFNARARERGRHRAAVRMALRSFATNCEQHHHGRWERSDFRLPPGPPPTRTDRDFVLVEDEDSQPLAENFLPWTRKYRRYLKLRRDGVIVENDRSLQELAQPLNGNQRIDTEEQAIDLLKAEILKENQEDQQKLEATNDRACASATMNSGQSKEYFSLNRWSGKNRRSIDEDLNEMSLDPVDTKAINGSYEVHEKSAPDDVHERGDGAPEITTGNMIPEEIKQFDFERDKPNLEDAMDSKEKFYPGECNFIFAETPFLQAMNSQRFERDLASGTGDLSSKKLPMKLKFRNLGKRRKTKPMDPIQLPRVRFHLPKPEPTHEAGEHLFSPPPLPFPSFPPFAFSSEVLIDPFAAPFDPRRGQVQYLRRNFVREAELQKKHAKATATRGGKKTSHNKASKITKPQPHTGARSGKSSKIHNVGADFSRKLSHGWTLDPETGWRRVSKDKETSESEPEEMEDVEMVDVASSTGSVSVR